MALTTGVEGDLAETALINRRRLQVCLYPATCVPSLIADTLFQQGHVAYISAPWV